MILFASLLLALAGTLSLVLAFERRRGPEGPVGAHLITGPLALAQALATAIGIASQDSATFGLPTWPLYLSLPGSVVAGTILPFLAMEQRWRTLARTGLIAAIAGSALAIHGPMLTPWAVLLGNSLVLLTGLGGYATLVAFWLHTQQQRVAAAASDERSADEFRTQKAAWQLGEWQKVPASAELWQLIPFACALHPEVAQQCHDRIAALPDLDDKMTALLRTDWAPHALRYVQRHYPHSRAPLAAALGPFLAAECQRWAEHLRTAPEPQNWAGNLHSLLDCAAAVIADGGELHESMRMWHTMLLQVRRLDGLATLAGRLAAGKGLGVR